MANLIHSTAFIHPSVQMGDGNYFGPNCVISANVRIGSNNYFGAGAAIGGPGEYRGRTCDAGVWIADRNQFSEFVTVHSGADRVTWIGSDGYFMVKSHIAHDATVGDFVTIAGSVMVAGYAHLMDHVTIGSNASVHPHCVVGAFAMIGQNTSVDSHIEVAHKVYGVPARILGVNTYKLEKLGLQLESLSPQKARWHELTAQARGSRRILSGPPKNTPFPDDHPCN